MQPSIESEFFLIGRTGCSFSIDQVLETLQTGGDSSNYRETERCGTGHTLSEAAESSGENHHSHNWLSCRCIRYKRQHRHTGRGCEGDYARREEVGKAMRKAENKLRSLRRDIDGI
jgi:hypothetical protein